MDDEFRCGHCFTGTVRDGVCMSCLRRAEAAGRRLPSALPKRMVLNDRYGLGDVLGSGGFGITYAAWDLQENHRVALKELYPAQDVCRGPDHMTIQVVPGRESYFQHLSRNFVNEANILMQLQGQQGMISIYDLFSANGTLYYTMEYLEGKDLKTYLLENGKLTWPQLAVIIRPVLEALEVLHGRSLIHRDISPDNIYLKEDDGAQLIDFGSVRAYQGNRQFSTFIKQDFAPLEQYQTGGNQGPWTDVYALCVTCYYALTGLLPPKAPDRRLHDTLAPIGEQCPQLPPQVAAALQKGMAVDVQDRFQDVASLKSALFAEEYRPQATVMCVNGFYRGMRVTLEPNEVKRVGRSPQCEVRYPDERREISGFHCTLAMNEAGAVFIRDDNSRNGTWLDGGKLSAGVWYRVEPGCRISVVKEEYILQRP